MIDMSQTTSEGCLVTVVIKALNEEQKIDNAISSALSAVEEVGGEVILADSFSTDKTIEIAQKYPIKIIQLSNPSERCCGIGPQLGYQEARGKYVYILDGDMQMLPGFFKEAIAFLEAHSEVGGVGGRVVEMNTESMEYQARVERSIDHMSPGEVDRLDMGGLYRASAIESVNYFSDRNLHSYEEIDLAVRLRAKGWTLHRIGVDAVKHWGHDVPPYQLLLKRWKSGYIFGVGELLRAALGKPHFKLVLQDVKELRIYFAVILWWILLVLVMVMVTPLDAKLLTFFMVLLTPIFAMTIKKQSLSKAIYSVVSWNFNTAGMLRGFFAPRKSPQTNCRVESTEIASS